MSHLAVCGQSASDFRRQAHWESFENPPQPMHIKGEKMMTITIKELPAKRLAVMEHHGDPIKLGNTLDKLITWAKAQPINLKPKPGEAFGFGYNDPRQVKPEEFRCDLALKVPKDSKLNDQVTERILPAGRHVVAMHKGSRDNIGDTIYSIYRDCLPQSGGPPLRILLLQF